MSYAIIGVISRKVQKDGQGQERIYSRERRARETCREMNEYAARLEGLGKGMRVRYFEVKEWGR